MKEEKKAYQVRFPKKIDDMIQEIMDRRGYQSKVTTLIVAVSELHGRVFKDYIEVQKNKVAMTPEEKVKAEMDVKEARVKMEEQKEYNLRKGFCDAMGGVEEIKGQTRVCKISKWHYQNEYKSEVPFEEMSQEVVDSQFNPDKETCIKWGAKIN